MKRFEVKAICTMVFPDVEAKTKYDAIQSVINKLPTNVEKDGVLKCAVILDDVSAECYDLMDASNNHDPDLVERINSAYNEKPEEFAKIVDLLARRDIDEWPNPEFYAQQPREKCRVYCQTIADNCDLRTILSYCRL